MSLTVFWFRRDLRIEDNAGLYSALKASQNVQPIFIFDTEILDVLEDKKDARVAFIHQTIEDLKAQFQKQGSDLWVFHGKPLVIFKELFEKHNIEAVFCNHDYEPKAIQRDQTIEKLCRKQGARFQTFKDQVIFEKHEILSGKETPYTVFTPYKKKWIQSLSPFYLKSYPTEEYLDSLHQTKSHQKLFKLKDLGFGKPEKIEIPKAHLEKDLIRKYKEQRDFPALDATSRLGIHLRFGTMSIRKLVREARVLSETWLSELIWREFFMQILFHFPHVEKASFRPEYDKVQWRKSKADFQKWCEGKTGYPFVDAGMRELNATGFMHNRVRMVTASFLTKHLLIYWLEGERYFAEKLLDYELAANNGNWQWAAGTGCDAAPYFRIFNPEAQAKRFDPDEEYIRKWVPELGTDKYPEPMINHSEARDRALRVFFKALKEKPK